jgi:hypothetical protein
MLLMNDNQNNSNVDAGNVGSRHNGIGTTIL